LQIKDIIKVTNYTLYEVVYPHLYHQDVFLNQERHFEISGCFTQVTLAHSLNDLKSIFTHSFSQNTGLAIHHLCPPLFLSKKDPLGAITFVVRSGY